MNKMINDVVDYLQKYEIDGFDYDWEFPSWSSDGNSADRERFTTLLQVFYYFIFLIIFNITNVIEK